MPRGVYKRKNRKQAEKLTPEDVDGVRRQALVEGTELGIKEGICIAGAVLETALEEGADVVLVVDLLRRLAGK